MSNYNLEKRRYVIAFVATAIVVVYIVRLFTLQLLSDDYKKNADSNAFLKKIEYPSRGAIYDRNGRLLVYNQPAYDIMVVMNEAKGRIDTLEFCQALGITKEFFIKRMNDIKDYSKNPGYSRFTQQLFMSQLPSEEFSFFQEKIFRFPGFYVQQRSIRQYQSKVGAHILGDVAEVSPYDIEEDSYYQPGDYIGKLGVEKSYEKQLRGEKGVQILLRDARGRIQGKYMDGKYDRKPIAGKDLTLAIDEKLQALGERLMEGKIGSIVALDPRTGEVLCMVSAPSYDPRIMVGRARAKNHRALAKDAWKPLLNRSIMGMVSHDQGSVLFTHLRELGGQSFQEVNDLIRFTFSALEVHQWGSEGNLLEMRNLHLGDDGVIGIFHAWDDVEGNNSNTGVAFILQFLESFFRGHFLDAFFGFDTVDNDMGSVCFEYRYIRMSFLDGCFYSIDSFSSCVFESGTEGHNEDSIFVWCILHSRVFCSPYTDGGSFAKSRGYILDFRIQFICIGGHAETKYTQSCHRCRQNSFQTFFHEKSLL